MKVFILCAGQASHWDKPGQSKHFLDIDGEPLVVRTVRLFGNCNPQVVCLAHQAGRYRDAKLAVLLLPFSECTCQTAWAAMQSDLQERTVILLGDVFYTDETAARIKAHQGSPVIFTDTQDIFALAWDGTDMPLVSVCLRRAVEATRKRAADPGSCRYAEGGRLWVAHHFLHPRCSKAVVTDRTQDFDKWSDYECWKAGGSKNRLFNKLERIDRTPKKTHKRKP